MIVIMYRKSYKNFINKDYKVLTNWELLIFFYSIVLVINLFNSGTHANTHACIHAHARAHGLALKQTHTHPNFNSYSYTQMFLIPHYLFSG